MKPLVIAHRGYHQKYFENTIEAFKEAAKRNVYGIETDIHKTKDGIWIIHHNDEIVSGGKHYVIKDMTYDELKCLSLDNEQGHKDARVPLLKDYLDICKESGKRPIIEIKNHPKWKDLKQVGKFVDEYMGLENVTFIGFYPQAMWKMRKSFHKRIHLQQLIFDHFEFVQFSCLEKMDIDITEEYLTQAMVDKMHKHNLKVNCWTINTKEQLDKVLALGVDYITTDTFCSDDL